MLKTLKNLTLGLGVALMMVSCSKELEDVNPSSTLGGVSTDAVVATNIINPFTFSDLSSSDSKTWTFTIKRTGDMLNSNTGKINNNPNIGSLFFSFKDCNDQIIALTAEDATVSIVGQTVLPKQRIGRSCNDTDMMNYLEVYDIKNPKLTDGELHTVSIRFNTTVTIKSAKVLAKASNNCYSTTLNGPGCDVIDLCGSGQGKFKDPGSWKGYTVTLGGHNYTETEGLAIMTPNGDNAGGLADSRAAFSQGATVLLNRQMGYISPSAYEAELAVIDAYLHTLNKLTTYEIKSLPTEDKTAKEAAGYIGDNITKCPVVTE